MRIKLFILSLLFSLSLQAAKHYVATGGGGAGTLISPFANLTQVNAHTFVAGDSLLFNKGDTFYGTLTMDASGTAGNPIYIGSYGTGAMPIITGFSTLASWTNNGDGRYWATVTGAEAQTNMVTVDGVNTAMGRYPDAGTNLTYESHNTTLSITNTGMGDATDWEGADVVINKVWWILERSHITDHTGDELTYSVYSGTSYSYINDNRYFFIQNDLRCVTSGNEWYHDYAAGRLYIWSDPSAKTVKIATLSKLIDLTTYDYITIDGIKLSGCINNAINIGNNFTYTGTSNNIIIKNCDIEYAGFIGISCIALQDNCTIDNNNITQCNADAILIYGDNMAVTNNDISYCGIVPGAFHRGTDNQGIRTYGNDGDYHLIEYNNIEYVGYNGVGIYSDTYSVIRYNYINYSMQITDDGGGIYRGSNNNYRSTVSNNIILNTAIGNINAVISRGIYTDARCSNMTITNNVVYNSQDAGIIIHSGRDSRIESNLLYDNKYGITFQYYDTINKFDTVRYNKVIATAPTDYAFRSVGFTLPQIQNFGTLDYNYYARPIDDDSVIMRVSVANYTIAAWYALTGHEGNTQGSPVVIDNLNKLHFIYNATQADTYYNVSTSMKDVTGANYSGIITLQPYTGLVLIGSGTVTEYIPGSGTIYYVKNGGNDALDGLSDANAWATVSKVNGVSFAAGDMVLFKKGNVWREYISFAPPAGTTYGRVTYSSYGIGDKPLFYGSKEENEVSDWTDQGGNIWKNADAQFNVGDGVGNLIFNGEESVGHKELTMGSVNAQGDWFWNDAERAVYLYSVGNPGTVYTDIECALDRTIITLGARDYITLDGLDVRYGGYHGIEGAYGNDNITIRNCHISYIGGCEFPDEMARVGNGIQFWAGATNILIENNVVEEIYDDGITPQTDTNTNTYTVQIDVIGNLVRNCRLGLHTFERSVNSTIQMNWYNNTVVGMGEEWGADQRPDSTFGARSVRIAGVTGTIDYFNIKNNIFYDAGYVCFYAYGSVPLSDLDIDYNLYYNTVGDIGGIESTVYATLGDWQAATSQEVHAIGVNPLFVSSTDFNLQSGSPAIDKGIDVGLSFNGSAPDIGAYESNYNHGVTFAKDANGNFLKDTNNNFIKIIQ